MFSLFLFLSLAPQNQVHPWIKVNVSYIQSFTEPVVSDGDTTWVTRFEVYVDSTALPRGLRKISSLKVRIWLWDWPEIVDSTDFHLPVRFMDMDSGQEVKGIVFQVSPDSLDLSGYDVTWTEAWLR